MSNVISPRINDWNREYISSEMSFELEDYISFDKALAFQFTHFHAFPRYVEINTGKSFAFSNYGWDIRMIILHYCHYILVLWKEK